MKAARFKHPDQPVLGVGPSSVDPRPNCTSRSSVNRPRARGKMREAARGSARREHFG